MSRPRISVRWLLFVAAFVVTAGFRYLLLGRGFPNDHFIFITGGWQMQFGEWPTRDWVDAGSPLMSFSSALAQAVFGPTLLAEAILVAGAFGLAAACTSAAVLELTGSVSLAVAASVLEVAVVPRTYGYPKMLVYAVTFLCFVRYVKRPDRIRLATMGASIAVAFLFRHDHGIFLAVGGALTALLVSDPTGGTTPARRVAELTAVTFVLVLPYLAFVQVNGGLWSYVRTGIRFSQQEVGADWHVWPAVLGDATPFASALVYEYFALPVVALVVLAVGRRDARVSSGLASVLPIAVVGTMVNYTFIRHPLDVRLPDAIVPAVLVGAWLVHQALRAQRLRSVVVPLAALGLALGCASVLEAGNTIDALDRAGVTHGWQRTAELFGNTTTALRAHLAPSQMPSRAAGALVPFFSYVERCTSVEDRLLVGGFMPEMPFLARRRFAAGRRYFGGSFGADAQGEQLALERLRGQSVPFVLIASDYRETFASAFPVLAEHLRSRYDTLTDVAVADNSSVRILVDTSMIPSGRDDETGWPCFVPSR
jgi:hypothetical protein